MFLGPSSTKFLNPQLGSLILAESRVLETHLSSPRSELSNIANFEICPRSKQLQKRFNVKRYELKLLRTSSSNVVNNCLHPAMKHD